MNANETDFFNWAESNGFSRRPGRFGALQSEAHQLHAMATRAVIELANKSDYQQIEVLERHLLYCRERLGATGSAWQKIGYSFAAELNRELKKNPETQNLSVEPRGRQWRLNERTAGGGIRMVGLTVVP